MISQFLVNLLVIIKVESAIISSSSEMRPISGKQAKDNTKHIENATQITNFEKKFDILVTQLIKNVEKYGFSVTGLRLNNYI